MNFILYFILFICSGCAQQLSKEATLTYKVIDRNTSKFTSEGYSVNATGMSMPDKLDWIYIEYKLNKKVYADEACDLVLKIAQDLVEAANDEKLLDKYLTNPPFTIENAHIAIQFSENNIGYQLPPYIAFALIVDGKCSVYEYDVVSQLLKEIDIN
jgi:hypothetical protein